MPQHSTTHRTLRAVAALAALLLIATSCSNGDDDEVGADSDGPATDIELVAEAIDFSRDELTVPVGEEVTVTLENRDKDVEHNFHVLGAEDATGDEIATPITTGPDTQSVTFTVDEAGTFQFRCDIHTNVMEGRLRARRASHTAAPATSA